MGQKWVVVGVVGVAACGVVGKEVVVDGAGAGADVVEVAVVVDVGTEGRVVVVVVNAVSAVKAGNAGNAGDAVGGVDVGSGARVVVVVVAPVEVRGNDTVVDTGSFPHSCWARPYSRWT